MAGDEGFSTDGPDCKVLGLLPRKSPDVGRTVSRGHLDQDRAEWLFPPDSGAAEEPAEYPSRLTHRDRRKRIYRRRHALV